MNRTLTILYGSNSLRGLLLGRLMSVRRKSECPKGGLRSIFQIRQVIKMQIFLKMEPVETLSRGQPVLR